MVGLTKLATALGLAMGLSALASHGLGQQTGGAAPAPAAPSAPVAPAPTPTTPAPGRGNTGTVTQPQSPMEMPRLIFLSGKVVLDDGTPPPGNVVIERVCGGVPHQEAHTDSKGRFSFQLGGNNMMLQDASMSGSADDFGSFGSSSGRQQGATMTGVNTRGVSERDLMNCEIRAALAGYRSDSAPLAGRRSLDNPDLGTIVLHKLGQIDGVTVSAISLQAPKDAKKAWEKGRDYLKKKKVPEAQKEFEKAVQIYPRYSHAWFDLGVAMESQDNTAGAYKAYNEAVSIDPKYVPPYHRLTGLYIKEQKWQEAADASGKLLKLNPFEYPDAHFNNAVANFFLKNYDQAEKSIREARKLDTRNRMVRSGYLLGSILIEKQDYAGAAEQIRQYLSVLPPGQTDENATKQLTALEKFLSAKGPQ
jgi:Tfp pilus assembly protein PilF